MESLPNDVIILICEYIDPYYCCSTWHDYNISTFCCCSIRTLYLTSKRFHFLSEYKYLIPKHSEYGATFTCVNYLGIHDGAQYMIYDNHYSGYVEKYNGITFKQIHVVILNAPYYVINDKVYCCPYDVEEKIYIKLCSNIYEKFNDNEILNFIWEKNFDKKILVRKHFPTINYQIRARDIKLEMVSDFYQKIAMDEYDMSKTSKKNIEYKNILDKYGIGSYIAPKTICHFYYPIRGKLIKYNDKYFIYVLDSGVKEKIFYHKILCLYILSTTVFRDVTKPDKKISSTKNNKICNEKVKPEKLDINFLIAIIDALKNDDFDKFEKLHKASLTMVNFLA
jgi:hypothetical protein